MNPKSHKYFKKDIAENVGVNASVVEDLVSFYFSKVRESLSNIDDSRVYVEKLGTFSVRKARLEKAIIKNKSYLGNLHKHTYNGYQKTIDTKKKIKKFEEVLEKIEETIEKRNKFKNNKA
jgi:nucleoid DNA-binding protein